MARASESGRAMKIDGKAYRSIWLEADGRTVGVIDQTVLPHRFTTRTLRNIGDAAVAICGIGVARALHEDDPLAGHVLHREGDLHEGHGVRQRLARGDVVDGGGRELVQRGGVGQHLLAHELARQARHVLLLVADAGQVAAVLQTVAGAQELEGLDALDVPDARRPGFAEECRRQSLAAARADAADTDLDAFLDAALEDLTIGTNS